MSVDTHISIIGRQTAARCNARPPAKVRISSLAAKSDASGADYWLRIPLTVARIRGIIANLPLQPALVGDIIAA